MLTDRRKKKISRKYFYILQKKDNLKIGSLHLLDKRKKKPADFYIPEKINKNT